MPGFGDDPLDQRDQMADVVARGELGNHAAVGLVQGDLRMQRVRQEPRFAVVDSDAGLVAGGFDAEDSHRPIIGGASGASARGLPGLATAGYNGELTQPCVLCT